MPHEDNKLYGDTYRLLFSKIHIYMASAAFLFSSNPQSAGNSNVIGAEVAVCLTRKATIHLKPIMLNEIKEEN